MALSRTISVLVAISVLVGLQAPAQAAPDDDWPPNPSTLTCSDIPIFGDCDELAWYQDMSFQAWDQSAESIRAGVAAISAPLVSANPSILKNIEDEIQAFGWRASWRQCVRKEIARTSYDIYMTKSDIAEIVNYYDVVSDVLDAGKVQSHLLAYLKLISPAGDFAASIFTIQRMEIFYADLMLCSTVPPSASDGVAPPTRNPNITEYGGKVVITSGVPENVVFFAGGTATHPTLTVATVQGHESGDYFAFFNGTNSLRAECRTSKDRPYISYPNVEYSYAQKPVANRSVRVHTFSLDPGSCAETGKLNSMWAGFEWGAPGDRFANHNFRVAIHMPGSPGYEDIVP